MLLSWWCHQMETFSLLLALCEGNPLVTGVFLSQRPVTRSFDVFFDLRLNKWLSKQSRHRWLETPARSLWRHCNGQLISRVLSSSSHQQTHTGCVKYACFSVLYLPNVIFLLLCGPKYIHVHIYMSKTEVCRNGWIYYSFWAQVDIMTWTRFLCNWSFVMGNHCWWVVVPLTKGH